MDCNLPGSSVHGILQARIQEWVAISFSICICICTYKYMSMYILCIVYIFHFVSVIFKSGTEITTLHMTCAIEVYFDLFLELIETSQIFLFS